jgi:flagellar hook protein FlgE
MVLSLDTGLSALEQFQQQINVIANNIANVNTVGFKQSDVNFADTLSETLGSNSAGAMQVGTGVTTSSISQDFSAGSLNSTGVQSNLAVNGNGFFEVQDPTTQDTYYTQDGSFSVNSSGNLVTSTGMEVQGLTGPIQISAGTSSASVTSYTIGTDGTVTVNLSDGTSTTAGQIELQNFSDPQQLLSVGNNLYTAPAAAGALTAAVAPGSSGTGTIESGYLEMSNVDLAGQLTSLISAQRAYQANSQVITTSDQVLQSAISMSQ